MLIRTQVEAVRGPSHTDIAYNPAFRMECGRTTDRAPPRVDARSPCFLIHSVPSTIWNSGIGRNLIRFQLVVIITKTKHLIQFIGNTFVGT